VSTRPPARYFYARMTAVASLAGGFAARALIGAHWPQWLAILIGVVIAVALVFAWPDP
jgi:uncharacterized membrane protein YccC